jgi:arsenate reductase
MAEGLLNAFFRDTCQALSAGIVPSEVNPYAIEVMKEIGIDISSQYSKSIEEFKDKKFDVVATVCDNAKEACPFFPGKKIIHKSFEDPSNSSGSIEDILKEFRKTRNQIKEWIQETFG